MEEFHHPAEALRTWLTKKNVTAYQLCKDTALPQSRISDILSGKRRISPETATHLGAFFDDTGAEYWLAIQARFDLNESNKDGAERQICWAPMSLGAFVCHAYVLANEVRVISANHFLSLFQIKSSAYASGSKLGDLINSPFLKSQKMDNLRRRVSAPIKFLNQNNIVTYGYEAETIVDYCHALLDLRRIGALPVHAVKYAEAAEMITVSLSKVGIVALIDEVTGFQSLRHRDALQKLFDAFFLKEYAAWAKRFPDQFYQEMFRLKGWKWSSAIWKRPPVVGKITKDIVYLRLAPGVLQQLETMNPIQDGRRKVKHHQYLTADVGHPALNMHLHAICALMKGHHNWDGFYHHLQLSFPKQNEHVQLELNDFRSAN